MLTGITVTVALMLAVAGVAQAATGLGTIGRTNPPMFSTPRATAGVAPGINPANTQDMTNRRMAIVLEES